MTVGLGRNGGGKLRLVRPGVYLFWCPGCRKGHTFNTSSTDHPQGKRWGFNGSLDKPSVDGLLAFDGCIHELRGGDLHYGDCTHDLSGQTVPLPEYPA
jgi:Family of unknown function (DUF6527)